MKTMAADKFKANCLKIMDDVCSTREPVLMTKPGRPVAKLVPVAAPKDDFLGRLEGIFKVVGDIESPACRPNGGHPDDLARQAYAHLALAEVQWEFFSG